ncbi:MAG TPA: hypothetical protein PKZ84_20995 [Anaerolineae bacterium]|nr:hypothetical protein [Anaerolineae bacterium]HQI85216.1 hypothetical protein [Anaerolineae bacterium]
MSEQPSAVNLANLFDQALQAVTAERQEINALDGYNGNHGDNMVSNMRLVANTIHANESEPPSIALRRAGQRLGEAGQGSTSQYYAKGLLEAAHKLEGRTQLERADGVTLLETLLGAVPAQDNPDPQQPTRSVLDLVMGLAGAQQQQAQVQPQVQAPQQQQAPAAGMLDMLLGLAGAQQPQAQPQPQPQQQAPAAGMLDMLLGLAGAQQPQAQPQPQPQQQAPAAGMLDMLLGLAGAQQPQAQPQVQAQPQDSGLDLGDILGRLLPAGLAYLQAKQSGADPAVARLALIRALLTARPNQAQTPRQAAGTVIAQSILKALMSR